MAKKIIKDLRIGDVIWKFNGIRSPAKEIITLLSNNEVEWGNTDRKKIEEGDCTSWSFKSTRYGYDFYLNYLDALNAQRKALDSHMKQIFSKQQDFLQEVLEANNKIRECDSIIARELTKDPKF